MLRISSPFINGTDVTIWALPGSLYSEWCYSPWLACQMSASVVSSGDHHGNLCLLRFNGGVKRQLRRPLESFAGINFSLNLTTNKFASPFGADGIPFIHFEGVLSCRQRPSSSINCLVNNLVRTDQIFGCLSWLTRCLTAAG